MLSTDFELSSLAYALGPPTCTGLLRATPEDFHVDEQLGFEPEGEGEHLWLRIRKRNQNTQDVARRLAQWAEVKAVDIGYAGLKDRRAVTTQWFSVKLAGRTDPKLEGLITQELEVVEQQRSRKKIKRGSLQGNVFQLTIRNLEGDLHELQRRLEIISRDGLPNYFGEQRFGRNNLTCASALFEGRIRVRDRHKRGLYLSAARSAIFNRLLSQRIQAGSWNRALEGDVMMLAGSHSIFTLTEVDDVIRQRVTEGDIHPTGFMWGKGALLTRGEPKTLEERVAATAELWCQGLERARMKQERRALRLCMSNMSWTIESKRGEKPLLHLNFQLPAGSYATVVLRECIG